MPAAGTTHIVAGPDRRLWVASKDSGVLRSREPLSVHRLRQFAADTGEVAQEQGLELVRGR